MAVDRSAFAAPKRPNIHEIPFPEAGEGETVCVKELPAPDLLALRARNGVETDTGNLGFVFDLLARTLCSPAGLLLFADGDDLQANFGHSVKTLSRLSDEVVKLSGLSVREGN